MWSLPEADGNRDGGTMVGELLKSMYGTRDAAVNWQKEVEQVHVGVGICEGKTEPGHILSSNESAGRMG